MRTIAVLLLAFPLLHSSAAGFQPGAGDPAKGKDKIKNPAKADLKTTRRFTVSKETTYVLGPIDQQGYINYSAALNKLMGEAVTPENNAAVLLYQALGPRTDGGEALPEEYFKLLGIEPPPAQGDYFVGYSRFLRDRLKVKKPDNKFWDELYNELYAAGSLPWKAREHENLAAWLKINEKPLALVEEATRRPRYFSPVTASYLIQALTPVAEKCRSFGEILCVRAMMRLAEGDADRAWRDIMTCHRLGRQVSNGSTLIECLIGIGIDQRASQASVVYLDQVRPDAKKLQACMSELSKLPPMREMSSIIDQGQRLMFLDCIMMVDRQNSLDAFLGPFGPAAKKKQPGVNRFLATIDWDPAMRVGQAWCDRLSAVMRIKDRSARKIEVNRIEQELKKLESTKTTEALSGLFSGGVANQAASMVPALNLTMEMTLRSTSEARGKLVGEMLVGMLFSGLTRLLDAEDRTKQINHNTQIAFALAWYQREQGRYPEKLDALVPKYLPEVPQDLFAGKPLIYRPSDKGYLLYSVGVNGKDDGGRTYADTPRGDDLTIRIPVVLEQQK